MNPKYYNSTRVANSTNEYDKRYNIRYSPVWWKTPLKGGAIAAIIMGAKEALNIGVTVYSNIKIKDDVNTAEKQLIDLFSSMKLYYDAEQSGIIPDEMQQSPNYQRAATDIINIIFSGETHNFNGSLNYKDDNDNWQIISGENYQQMVLDFGNFIFNTGKIDSVSENNYGNLAPVNKITFDIKKYKDKK
ncbi:MAG: hypothetical protein GXO89_13530 [Chlorobi bacterium]|nr:hypothetical protein [Chlorobiota bacterium]